MAENSTLLASVLSFYSLILAKRSFTEYYFKNLTNPMSEF